MIPMLSSPNAVGWPPTGFERSRKTIVALCDLPHFIPVSESESPSLARLGLAPLLSKPVKTRARLPMCHGRRGPGLVIVAWIDDDDDDDSYSSTLQ